MIELASANIPIKTTQKHAAPPVIPNSLSCQCGSKGAERLGRFKWGPGQYNCQQRGLRGALQLLCSSTAEEIEILPGRFFARFLRIKKAHPLTMELSIVFLRATLYSEAIAIRCAVACCLAKQKPGIAPGLLFG